MGNVKFTKKIGASISKVAGNAKVFCTPMFENITITKENGGFGFANRHFLVVKLTFLFENVNFTKDIGASRSKGDGSATLFLLFPLFCSKNVGETTLIKKL